MCLYLYIHLPLYIFYNSHAVLQEMKFTDLRVMSEFHPALYKPSLLISTRPCTNH